MGKDKNEGPRLNVDGFVGTVMCMDWVYMPDGRLYRGIHGTISAMSDVEAVGWEAKGHNTANWLARIAGRTSSVNLMGCQVRMVIEGPAAAPSGSGVPDIYVVP